MFRRMLPILLLVFTAMSGQASAQAPVDSVMVCTEGRVGGVCYGGQLWYRTNGTVRFSRADGKTFRAKLSDSVTVKLTSLLDSIAIGIVPPRIPEPGMVCGSLMVDGPQFLVDLLKGGFRRRVVHDWNCGTDDETPGQAVAAARDYRFRAFEQGLMRAVDLNKWMTVKK